MKYDTADGYSRSSEVSKTDENYMFIVSNQNIYDFSGLYFARNHGYTYDSSKELSGNFDEVVRVTNDTVVYDGAAVNYDEIVTLKSGEVVLRVKENVNETNGHNWDKIRLNNGTEGYVFSQMISKTSNYEYIMFEDNEKTYNVYCSPIEQGVNIEDYPYYAVKKNEDDIEIYYSKSKFEVAYGDISGQVPSGYALTFNDGYFKITVLADGTLKYDTADGYSRSSKVSKTDENYIFIASNQDIYDFSGLYFEKKDAKTKRYNLFIEGGIDFNENVRVEGIEELNVMSETNIDSTILATLNKGDVVRRIKGFVGYSDGCVWDKIRLNDGTEGYVDTKYLSKIIDNSEIYGSYNGEITKYSSNMNSNNIPMYDEEYSKMVLSEAEAGNNIYAENLLEHIYEDESLLYIKGIVHDVAVICAYNTDGKLVEAGENLLYYLTKGEAGNVYGEEIPYEVEPYKSGHVRRELIGYYLIADSDKAFNRMQLEVGKAINAAEKYALDESKTVNFVSVQERMIELSKENDDSINWELALGGYRIFTEAAVTKNGTSYTMNLEYHIEDYYDWREEDENFAILELVTHFFQLYLKR